MCVCVCVLVYATLWGPNVPTRIEKPENLDIVGTGLQSPRGGKNLLKIVNDVYLKVSQCKQVFCKGEGLGLGDRTYCLVSIKEIEVYGKSPQFT